VCGASLIEGEVRFAAPSGIAGSKILSEAETLVTRREIVEFCELFIAELAVEFGGLPGLRPQIDPGQARPRAFSSAFESTALPTPERRNGFSIQTSLASSQLKKILPISPPADLAGSKRCRYLLPYLNFPSAARTQRRSSVRVRPHDFWSGGTPTLNAKKPTAQAAL
jgi:hypothetical protein